MGKNTKIIATVVPVRMHAADNSLIMDVFFSPRLPDSGLLEDYYEIKNWPAYADMLKQIDFKLELFALGYTIVDKKFNYYTLPGTPAANIDKSVIEIIEKKDPFIRYRYNDGSFFSSDNTGGYPFSKENPVSAVLWNQMLRAETPVSGWLINEVDYNLAAKLSRDELKKNLSDAIDRTIEELLSNGGYSSQPGDATPGEISSFVMYLHQLKLKAPEVITSDPLLRSNPVNTYQRLFVTNLRNTLEALVARNDQQVQDQSMILTAQEQEVRNAQETGEFHKRFSAYSNYPFLLRNTGWIWELKVPISKLNADALKIIKLIDKPGVEQYLKYIKLTFEPEVKWQDVPATDEVIIDDQTVSIRGNAERVKRNQISKALFLHEIDILSPGTCFESSIKDNVFQPGSNPEFGQKYFKIEHGVILARPTGSSIDYEIEPHLIDKVQLFEKLKGILTDNISKLNSVSGPAEDQSFLQSVSDEFKDVQGNSQGSSKGNEYVSNGISLNIRNLKAILQNVLNSTPETQTGSNAGITAALQVIKDGLVYAHNLHVGYRVDVAMFEDDKLAGIDSLCRRKEYYCICVGKGNVWAENPSEFEEGWLMESTQASQSGLTYVDDELFRWNDWSLVCPQMGEHEDVERPNEEELKDPTKLNITEVPPDGSLIPLRFGNNYRFRLRVVDICGNNSGYLNQTITHIDPLDPKWTVPLPYQRLDSINTPLIIPGHRIYTGVERVDNNASRKRLVWDSKRMGEDLEKLVIRAYFENDTLKTEQSSIRYIGPPKANLHFVLKHKVLDSILANDFRAEAIKNDLFDRADLEVMPSDIYFKRSQEPINYLFDPVVTGFDAIHNRKRYPCIQVPAAHLSAAASPYWLPWQFMELRLERPAVTPVSDAVTIQNTNVKMTVTVKAGVETDLLLGCTYFEDVDPIFHECVDKIKRANIQLVHAVQKPCLINSSYTGAGDPVCRLNSDSKLVRDALSRVPEKNNFSFNMFFDRYPVYTTDAATLHMQYADIVSDRTTTKGYRFEPVQKVIKTGLHPASAVSEENVSFNNLEYVFPDSKFRRVNLRMESVSKFKQYFPAATEKDYFSVYGNVAPWMNLDEANKLEDGEQVLRAGWELVQSTNRPEPLVIERIVPLISWEKEVDANGYSIERYTDTIRIYFDGDWYTSGEEEKVAIFYLDEGDANSTCVPLELENVISQFGKDPAGESLKFGKWDEVLKLLYDKKMFTTSGITYVDGIEAAKLDFNPSPTADQPFCQPAAGQKVKAAILDVKYAPPAGDKPPATGIDSQDTLGKFYVDVRMDISWTMKTYFPFVRFAIARYQKNSLIGTKDYRFSKITVADFVQLLPYRKLQIQKQKDQVEFKLDAPTYRKTEGGGRFSKVYVHEGDDFFKLDRQLAKWNDTVPKEMTQYVDNTVSITLPIRSSVFTKYVIEEYEEYDDEGDDAGQPLEIEDNPRMDFTKRLVFSYIVDL